MAITIAYLEAHDQTLIIKEVSARNWACHWAGTPSEKDIKEAMKRGEVVFHPFNCVTGNYIYSKGRGRRFRR
jgi:hypothetical protein